MCHTCDVYVVFQVRTHLNYNNILCYNIKATQELCAENTKLKTEISEMKEDIKMLKALLNL